jgi:hypothetical protein
MRPDDPAPDVGEATPPSGPAPTRLARLKRSAGAAAAAAEPIVAPVGHAIDAAIGAARGSLPEMPGARVRRIRRLGHQPLASLPELYPESRQARPVEIGLRTIDVDDIRGTAVGGGNQRGGDFLPLKAFRGRNWSARWQRLRRAHDALTDLPPIDVVKYDDGYWVRDGHNRVALAKYTGQVGIDASVTELVPSGGQRTEPLGSLATEVESSRLVRGRVDAEAAGDPTPTTHTTHASASGALPGSPPDDDA